MLARANHWDDFTLITAIDPKVVVHSHDGMVRIQFAHSYKTKVSQIRLAISITQCQLLNLRKIVLQVEREF